MNQPLAQDATRSSFVADMTAARSDNQWRQALRRELGRIRNHLAFYPPPGAGPGATLESTTHTVREIAADCLPLGIALVMHLYPLCALQCAPLPRMGIAGFKRRILMKRVTDRGLIVANGGSERANGAHQPLDVTLDGDALRVNGAFEYVSLASVADVVLFSAPLGERTVFCAADLRGDSVRLSEPKFEGGMRFSDTRSMAFVDHRVAAGNYLLVADGAGAKCIYDYQRAWFHLLLAEAYLARIELLRGRWQLEPGVEQVLALSEVSCLREYATRLLDDCRPQGSVDALTRVTASLKLRVSLMAQATGRSLRELATRGGADAADLIADAGELGYMRMQPTTDDRILKSLASGGSGSVDGLASLRGPAREELLRVD
jgi:hypothetical protein